MRARKLYRSNSLFKFPNKKRVCEKICELFLGKKVDSVEDVLSISHLK